MIHTKESDIQEKPVKKQSAPRKRSSSKSSGSSKKKSSRAKDEPVIGHELSDFLDDVLRNGADVDRE